jgi:hypothetical protein
VVYYERPHGNNRNNSYLKHGEKYPGLSKPDKQVHNTGFWYLWKDIPIKSFEEFCETELEEWALKFEL